MNDIRDLFPGRMRERTFQLKAKRDAGAIWHEQQFVECKHPGNQLCKRTNYYDKIKGTDDIAAGI